MKTNKLLCLILTFMMLFTFTPAFAATDAEAVDAVLAKAAAGTLVDGMTEITSTLTLPAQVEEDGTAVTLTWALAQTELATLSDNCLTVTAVSLTEDLTLPLTVTAACGDVSKSGSALAKVTVDKGGMPVAPTDPADERYYINEDFTDTTLDGGLTFGTAYHSATDGLSASVDTSTGMLVFNAKNTTKVTVGMRLYFSTAFSGATYDGTVFEFKFNVPSASFSSYINMDNSKGTATNCSTNYRVIKGELNTNGYTYYNGSTQVYMTSTANTTYTNKYVVDFTNGEYDLYVDDALVAEDVKFSHTSGNAEIKSLFLGYNGKATDTTNGHNWSIDYIKVYKTGWEDPVAVDTPPTATYASSVTLDTNDGDIAWESSNTDIISISGETATITRPAVDTDVTLTAYKVVNGVKNFKTYTVTVYGNMIPPQVGSDILFEDFSGSDGTALISTGTSITQNTLTSATITGGKLVLTGESGKRGYFNFGKTVVPDEGYSRLAFEWDIEVVNNTKVVSGLANGTTRRVDLRYTPGGNIKSTNGTGFYMNNTYPSLSLTTPSSMTITAVVDYTNNTYNVYLNGIEIGRNISSGTGEIKNFDFYMDGSANTVYVDNIKIYNVGLNLNDKVDADAAAIEAAGIAGVNTLVDGLVESNFAATATVNGSTIKYSSVNGYVNADGTLNRPALTDTDTVTATVYCGTYEKSISFENVKIAGNLVVKELDETASGAQDGKYTAVFPAYTLDGEPKTVTMFVAHYTPDGSRMLAIKYVAAKTINPKGTGGENGDNIVEELLLDSSDISATPNVKAFIWSDEQSISPLPLVK